MIDVSGDGVNNSGRPAELARDEAVAAGIVINGLPIVNDRPTFGRMPSIPLDQYFAQSVIGGPGAFMVVAEDFESFADKLGESFADNRAMLEDVLAALFQIARAEDDPETE